MKIIIEGEPKEIATLELALKDGKNIVNVANPIVQSSSDQLKHLAQHLAKGRQSLKN